MDTHAEKLRIAASRCTRHNADVALLCEHAATAADRLDVLEEEHMRFFDRWHEERRKREAMAVHYDHLCSLVLAAGMLAPHGNGAKEILDEAEQYMVSAAESWQRSNAQGKPPAESGSA
jgi:hypothetical protein